MREEVLDHGYVELIDSMGDDLRIVNAARTSFDQRSDEMNERDQGLIGFLMRERHGTPFEQAALQFEVQAPLFVFREWHRHRIGWSYNEMSGRYTELPELFYVPDVDDIRKQVGKPGAYTYESMPLSQSYLTRNTVTYSAKEAFRMYRDMLEMGVAKEVARLVLPVNTYSKMVATCNPRSLMHFLGLRNNERAQKEIRLYAAAMEKMFATKFPVTAQAFVESGRVCP